MEATRSILNHSRIALPWPVEHWTQRDEEATSGEIGTECVKVRFSVSVIEATSAPDPWGTK
jgi:hypothetical protein